MALISFQPGPTEPHPIIEAALKDAVTERILSLSHRSDAFSKIYENVQEKLRAFLFVPKTSHIFFLASATEAMERILQNLVEKRSHHLINGAFSERFCEFSSMLGKTPTFKSKASGDGFNPHEEELPKDIELLCLTHNETSTGVWIPEDSINKCCKINPNLLVAVDMVSSCPYPNLDLSLIDCAFFSVQKCFGLPAGLGVLIVSDRALIRAKELEAKGLVVGSYHSFKSLAEWESKLQTPETPNVLSIYLLSRVLDAYTALGAEAIRQATDEKARIIFEAIEKHPFLEFSVVEEKYRSKTVITFDYNGDANKLRESLKDRGFEIGSGYKEKKIIQSRIANFPMHSTEQIKSLMAAIGQ